MSAEIVNVENGIITVKITGKLTQPELRAVQNQGAAVLQRQKSMRILVVAQDFQGWQSGGDWGDLSFQMDNDEFIEKIAIVGEKKWADLALIFAAKGLRKFPVEYFLPTDLAKARAWLAE